MTIKLYIGNVGSGKTAYAVREIINSPCYTASNIETKDVKKNIRIEKGHLMKQTLIKVKKNGEEVNKIEFNKEYWLDLKKKHKRLNVVIDEAHTILNSRQSMSKRNIIMTNFLALIRKIIGDQTSGYGDFVLISQLVGRIDTIGREMAHQVKYFRMYNIKRCSKCFFRWVESSDDPENRHSCGRCNNFDLVRDSFQLHVWSFKSYSDFWGWKEFNRKSFYSYKIVKTISQVFPMYNTLQWDNIID